MLTFTMRHELDCTPERYWELFFDDELEKQIYASLGYPKYEVLETRETDTEIMRFVKTTPKFEAPAAIMKLIGDSFSYVEEGRFVRDPKAYHFKIVPSTLADKIKNAGSVRIEPRGDGKCTRVVEITAEAKIFGLGGMIEKVLEKSHRDGWAKSAVLFNKFAKQ